MNAIEIKNITRKQGEFFELQCEELILPCGCIMGLIGKNGAGKSTLIHLLLGMIRKDGGEADFRAVFRTEGYGDFRHAFRSAERYKQHASQQKGKPFFHGNIPFQRGGVPYIRGGACKSCPGKFTKALIRPDAPE